MISSLPRRFYSNRKVRFIYGSTKCYTSSPSFVISAFKIMSSNKCVSTFPYPIITPSNPFLASLSLHIFLFFLLMLASAFQVVSSDVPPLRRESRAHLSHVLMISSAMCIINLIL